MSTKPKGHTLKAGYTVTLTLFCSIHLSSKTCQMQKTSQVVLMDQSPEERSDLAIADSTHCKLKRLAAWSPRGGRPPKSPPRSSTQDTSPPSGHLLSLYPAPQPTGLTLHLSRNRCKNEFARRKVLSIHLNLKQHLNNTEQHKLKHLDCSHVIHVYITKVNRKS